MSHIITIVVALSSLTYYVTDCQLIGYLQTDTVLSRAIIIVPQSQYNTPISMMIMDIDFFKDVNDTYGHDKGDDVLCYVAEQTDRHANYKDTVKNADSALYEAKHSGRNCVKVYKP